MKSVGEIRRESRERDREFNEAANRGFAWGLTLGIWAAALILFLYFTHAV